jgi:hypothetical protein
VDLCTSILGLFAGPTPHLNSLDVDFVELLDRINAAFSSLENLWTACSYAAEFQIAQLHHFTSSTTLTIRPTPAFNADDSVSTTAALPLLKEIKFRRTIPSRQVQFDLPLISSLHFIHIPWHGIGTGWHGIPLSLRLKGPASFNPNSTHN